MKGTSLRKVPSVCSLQKQITKTAEVQMIE